MGIVEAMVKTPHELSANAFTTTNPNPAIAITKISKMAIDEVNPLTLFISTRAISASDLPSERVEAYSIIKSCTAPAKTDPTSIQTNPGKYPN